MMKINRVNQITVRWIMLHILWVQFLAVHEFVDSFHGDLCLYFNYTRKEISKSID